jgi:uncharacterized metal-binding protein YceD (DUF177 family)
MKPSPRPWSVSVRLEDVPAAGRHLEISPDEPTRAAIARAAGVEAVSRLDASFDLTPHGRDGLHVTGSVSASVRQTCVVTLEPVVNEIDEVLDLIFAPARATSGAAAAGQVAEEGPEPLVDGAVDLGAVATEFLILGIDPYPRKPDAVFIPPADDDADSKPFAALAALKKGAPRKR